MQKSRNGGSAFIGLEPSTVQDQEGPLGQHGTGTRIKKGIWLKNTISVQTGRGQAWKNGVASKQNYGVENGMRRRDNSKRIRSMIVSFEQDILGCCCVSQRMLCPVDRGGLKESHSYLRSTPSVPPRHDISAQNRLRPFA